jgi:hypothetical protein
MCESINYGKKSFIQSTTGHLPDWGSPPGENLINLFSSLMLGTNKLECLTPARIYSLLARKQEKEAELIQPNLT